MARRLIADRLVAVVAAAALAAAGCSTDDQAGPTVSVVSETDSAAPSSTSEPGSSADVEGNPNADAPTDVPQLFVASDATLLSTAPIDGNRVYSGVLDVAAAPVVAQIGDADGYVAGSDPERPSGPPTWVPVIIDADDDGVAGRELEERGLDGRQAIPFVYRFGSIWVPDASGNDAADGIVPDTIPVSNDTVTVLLVEPTERYPHGALGDTIEAAAIRIVGPTQTIEISLPESDVVEGTSAMLADLDDDGTDEIIVTQANRTGGARLVAYGLDGELIAESEPIGTANRWRHQIAVGPTGPDGETELVVVRTPHIGGIVEWFRLVGTGDDARLELVASFSPATGGINTTSHPIGTTLLDLAAVVDADGDGELELLIPTQDRSSLAVVGRTEDGAELEELVEVPSMISTNLAIETNEDGSLTAAVGTNDGQLVTWGSSP